MDPSMLKDPAVIGAGILLNCFSLQKKWVGMKSCKTWTPPQHATHIILPQFSLLSSLSSVLLSTSPTPHSPLLRVFVPEIKGAIGAGRGKSPPHRVERQHIHLCTLLEIHTNHMYRQDGRQTTDTLCKCTYRINIVAFTVTFESKIFPGWVWCAGVW